MIKVGKETLNERVRNILGSIQSLYDMTNEYFNCEHDTDTKKKIEELIKSNIPIAKKSINLLCTINEDDNSALYYKENDNE